LDRHSAKAFRAAVSKLMIDMLLLQSEGPPRNAASIVPEPPDLPEMAWAS
jgi:hypothetical protein